MSGQLIHQCCYHQVVHRLGELASQVPAAYTWEDVVLPEAQKRLMRQACAHIQYQHQVYCRWDLTRRSAMAGGSPSSSPGRPARARPCAPR